MGYEKIIMPLKNAEMIKKHNNIKGCEIAGVKNINDAMKAYGENRR